MVDFISIKGKKYFERAEYLEDQSINDTIDEYDFDKEDDYERACIQNGIDGGTYEVCSVKEKDLIIDEDIELSNGDTVSVNDILSKINEENEEDDY